MIGRKAIGASLLGGSTPSGGGGGGGGGGGPLTAVLGNTNARLGNFELGLGAILAPVNTVPPVVSLSGITLSSTTGTWTGASSFTYQWQLSVDGLTWTNVSGATSNATAASQFPGLFARCQVTGAGTPNVTVNSNVLLVPPTGTILTTRPDWIVEVAFTMNPTADYKSIAGGDGPISYWRMDSASTLADTSPASTSIVTATFGRSSQGTILDQGVPDEKEASSFTLSDTAHLTSITGDISGVPGGGGLNQDFNFLIYADNAGAPGALLMTGPKFTIGHNQGRSWLTLDISSLNIQLAPGTYWLGFIAAVPDQTSYAAGGVYIAGGGTRDINANTYTSGPSNPFGTVGSSDSNTHAIYVTYTKSVANPPNNGSLVGTPTLVTGALPFDTDQALSFNGTSSAATVPNATDLRITGNLSLEGWVYLPSLPTGTRNLINKTSSYALQVTSAGKVQLVLANGANSITVLSNTVLATSTWYHVCGTYNGATASVYVNGVLDNSAAYTFGQASNTNPVTFAYDGTTNWLACSLDEMAIYNVALTASQVLQHYYAKNAGPSPVWTDISGDVREITTSLGRQFELNRMEAGQTTVVLNDAARNYDPANTSSPYWPNVIPGRMLRIRGANNELANGNFEALGTTGWQSNLSATLTLETVTVHTGTRSLKVVTDAGAANSGCLSALIPVTAGDDVQGRAWINATNGAPLELHLEELDINSAVLRTNTTTFTGTGAWQQVTAARFTTGTGTANVRLLVGTQTGHAAATTFYLDDAVCARVYPRFRGHIERWPDTWIGPNYAECHVIATDGFEPLAAAAVTGATTAGLTGAAISTVLDRALWAPTLRSLDLGALHVVALTLSGDALSVLQGLADDDGGIFFMSRSGLATFHDQNHRTTNSRSTTAQAIFGDYGGDGLSFPYGSGSYGSGSYGPGDGSLPYLNLVPSYDKDHIINDWQVTPDSSVSSTAQEVIDPLSVSQYFKRTSQLSTNLSSTVDALARANYALAITKQPKLRFDQLTVKPTLSLALLTASFQLAISDRVTVKRQPLVAVSGSQIVQDCFIEHIEWHSTPADETVTWQLSPVP